MAVTPYVEKVRIFNHYTNCKGRLSVKTLCDLFNDAAEVQTEQYGVDVATLNAAGITWMLHRLHIRLHKMPHQNEEVYIETWPSGVDRLFALRDYRLFREDGEELVRATSEWMYIDLKRRRPLRLPEKVVRMSTGHGIPRLELPSLLNAKEFRLHARSGRRFVATFDHIDFNGHVTQASYVRWMTNALPFEFLQEYVLTDIEVVYEHEILPDHAICSDYEMAGFADGAVTVWHRVYSEAGGQVHCIARSEWKKK